MSQPNRSACRQRSVKPLLPIRFCSFRSVLQSVLAAFLGVQSEQKRQQDFQSTSIWPFVVTGVILTLIFVLLLVFLARKLAG